MFIDAYFGEMRTVTRQLSDTNAFGRSSRGFVKEGYEVLRNIYGLCADTPKAKIYPGIPEHINSYGQGKYHYVTGSASWLLMTLLTQVYGVRGEMGDLILDPKLTKEQFDNGVASVTTTFAGKKLEIVFEDPGEKEFGEYAVQAVSCNDLALPFEAQGNAAKIKRQLFRDMARHSVLKVRLG